MIRLATTDDTSVIADALYDYVEQSRWSLVYTHWPTRKVLKEFVTQQLTNPRSLLLVYEHEGIVTGFCGVTLSQFYTPPFIKTMFEWGWYGEPKVAASLWRQCCDWAKERGVELAGRGSITENSTHEKVVEQMTWRRL